MSSFMFSSWILSLVMSHATTVKYWSLLLMVPVQPGAILTCCTHVAPFLRFNVKVPLHELPPLHKDSHAVVMNDSESRFDANNEKNDEPMTLAARTREFE